MEKAQQYIAGKEYKSAIIEFKNVVQLDPKNDKAYFEMAETYMKMTEIELAARTYAEAIKSNQNNIKAYLKLGQILLLAQKPLGARKAAKAVLEKEPKNIEAFELMAAVQMQEKNLSEAIQTLQQAAAIDPTNSEPRLFLAHLLKTSGNADEAEQTYLQAISIDASDPVPYIKLARLYGEKGQWDKTEAVLAQMGPAAEKGYRSLADLAHECELQKQFEIAEKIFIKATDLAPKDDTGPLVNLGDYYARRGVFPKALEIMEKADGLEKDNPTILSKIGSLYLELQDVKAADATTDKALAKDDTHPVANFIKGKIHFIRKEFIEAEHRFDQSLKKAPSNGGTYYYKALCQMSRGPRTQSEPDLFRSAAGYHDDEEAWTRKLVRESLEKAVELDANLLDAKLLLADLYLRERDTDKARKQINEALALAPDYLKTLTLSGSLKLLEGDLKGAEALCKQVLEKNPDLSSWHARLGLVYITMKQPAEALKAYQRAVDLAPFFYEALKSIVYIHLHEKNFIEALKVCERQKGKVLKSSTAVAQIETLEGKIFLAQGKLETAIQHFNEALAQASDLIEPRMALATVFIRSKKLDDATPQYEKILKANPDYLPACMGLGDLYYLKDNKKQAIKYYRQALAINNSYAPAANSLAYLLSDDNNKLREAFDLAKMAEKKMPNNAAVKDTVGWLNYRIGNFQQAIESLQKSLEINPKEPMVHYHLGLAFYQTRAFDKAKEHIKKALEIDPNFKGAAEARAMLD